MSAEAVTDIAASEVLVFTILDAKQGYHQCLMDEQCQLLITFLASFGHFKYKRAPYGLSSIASTTTEEQRKPLKDCPGSAE